MRSRRHVHEVALVVGTERIRAGEVVERSVDLFEVPRVADAEIVHLHLGLRRHVADVGDDFAGEPAELRFAQELEPPDQEVVVPTEVDGRAPALPAVAARAVERRAQEADDDHLHGFRS